MYIILGLVIVLFILIGLLFMFFLGSGIITFFRKCPKCTGWKTIMLQTYHYEDREHGDKDRWDGFCTKCGKIHEGITFPEGES